MPWRAPGPGKGSGKHRYGAFPAVARHRAALALSPSPLRADPTSLLPLPPSRPYPRLPSVPALPRQSGCSSPSRTASSACRPTTRCATARPRVAGTSTSRRSLRTSSAAGRSSAQTTLSSRLRRREGSLLCASRERGDGGVYADRFANDPASKGRGRAWAFQGVCQLEPWTSTTHAPSSTTAEICAAESSTAGGPPSGGTWTRCMYCGPSQGKEVRRRRSGGPQRAGGTHRRRVVRDGVVRDIVLDERGLLDLADGQVLQKRDAQRGQPLLQRGRERGPRSREADAPCASTCPRASCRLRALRPSARPARAGRAGRAGASAGRARARRPGPAWQIA